MMISKANTAKNTSCGHPWILAGPWYRWLQAGVAAAGRTSRPALEMYAAPDFVESFLADPQKSLEPRAEDRVYPPTRGKRTFNPRKIFLPTHSRFYLVVCELHCDVAGLPHVKRDKVCEAGFVVRRRHGQKVAGWVSSQLAGIGAWQTLTAGEEPLELAEEVFPLYPLIPDPAAKAHSAAGATIWFGVLPAGSSDVDASGLPRFADRSLYEVRCFVRRHNPKNPRTAAPGDCCGKLVWSRSSEPYRLAPTFDLAGTSHRPVNVQLPDLKALKAQAEALKPGEGAGMRMISPPDSSLLFDVDSGNQPASGSVGGASVCFYSIPLVTIVATFVLNLFLPVVVFLFNLWFLLRIRFCIPPKVSLDAGLAARLAATDFEAGDDVTAGLDLTGIGDLQWSLHAALAGLPSRVRDGLRTAYAGDINGLAKLVKRLASDFSHSLPKELQDHFDPPAGTTISAKLPAADAGLKYYARVGMPS